MAFVDAWLRSTQVGSANNFSSGVSGVNQRFLIESAHIIASGSKIKVTVRSGDARGFTIDKMYIGQQASSGDAYDFEGAPTKITWGGLDAITIGAVNTNATSDEITFSFSSANNYVISAYVASADESYIASDAIQWWYKGGADDSTTVNTTGYSNSGNYFATIQLIEAEAAGGEYIPRYGFINFQDPGVC